MISTLSTNSQLAPVFWTVDYGLLFLEYSNYDRGEEEPLKENVLLDMSHQQAQQVSEEA